MIRTRAGDSDGGVDRHPANSVTQVLTGKVGQSNVQNEIGGDGWGWLAGQRRMRTAAERRPAVEGTARSETCAEPRTSIAGLGFDPRDAWEPESDAGQENFE